MRPIETQETWLSLSCLQALGRWDLHFHAMCAQVLTADWCKYNDCVIATGSVDKSVKVWDVRAPERELTTLLGHTCGPGAYGTILGDEKLRVGDVRAGARAHHAAWPHVRAGALLPCTGFEAEGVG